MADANVEASERRDDGVMGIFTSCVPVIVVIRQAGLLLMTSVSIII